MFKLNMRRHNQGFTLVEVLVAILLMVVFVTVAMQAIVIAAVFKVRARQLAEATTWIQEDLESVRNKAALPLPSAKLTAPAGNVLVVDSSNRFEVGDKLMVGTDTVNNVVKSTDLINKTITLEAPLGSTPLVNDPVVVIRAKRCNATTSTAGFADYLQDNLPPLSASNSNSTTKTFSTGVTYTLTRTSTIKDVKPYEVLELKYEVKKDSSISPIVTINTEVIPDAAFQCPEK